jgi:sigma-B regulation protein RsbU (phosphoserine phosphatase)
MKYTPYQIQMEKGTTIFLYTDGVPEAVDSENHNYGTGRLLNALNKNPDAELSDLVNTVKKDIQTFAGKADQFDDLTVLVVRYNGTDSSKAA